MIDNIRNKQKIRCAIYTRKSCEEGLEQEFNSLDAQRASAENYISSQAHEGWVLVNDYYDDGGFSGGNLERPALQRLFQDIREDKIDCIIVYKIDRLTRSLLDFSKIIQLLDEHNVSFVSVTQSFNTANSMGRLMLNVLLSFAQYERELTSERIKDKLEASCKRGMWMGGNIPLGYDVKDRKLLINEKEAKIVRILFQNFAETASITETARELNNLGFTTKTWISNNGKLHKGKRFNKSNVRRILNNHLYIGKVKHKDKLFDGMHKPIIDEQIWQKTRDLLSTNNKIQLPSSRVTTAPLLKGIMNCGICGSKMTPTYTTKQGKRYRYYICQSKHKGNNDLCKVGRISASETENLVTDQVLNFLKKPEFIIHTINAKKEDLSENKIINSFKTIDKIWDELFVSEQARIINLLIKQIDIKPEGLNIKIFKEGLHSLSTELTN
jgi:DNA invertase Pin-like site-specific DNA recombinase